MMIRKEMRKFISLPLEGKVGGGLRRSDEVVEFYLITFKNIRLQIFHLISRLRDSFPSRGSLGKTLPILDFQFL